MSKKNLLLVSMDDPKISKVANVVSNKSCKKILDYLADKDATETDIAKKLDLPLSTAHYNLQQLMDAGLIEVDEYHYSEKGKEVNHYKLANKYIIITPKKTVGIKNKLKSILPVALIALGIAGIIQFTNKYFSKPLAKDFAVAESAAIERAADAAPVAALQTAPVVMEAAPTIFQNIALWFLVGAIFALVIYTIINLRKSD